MDEQLHELVPASSPSNDQLVGSLGRAGNTRRKGCLEILPLHNCSFKTKIFFNF